jgi:acyl carrier protein
MLNAESLDSDSTAATVQSVVHREIGALLQETGTDVTEVSDNDQLQEIGLDSLLLARLIIVLEDALGVDPFADDDDPADLSEIRSVGAMIATYERALDRAATQPA